MKWIYRPTKHPVLLLLFLLYLMPSHAQNSGSGTLEYRLEAFGSAATDEYTPFWIVSNQYGAVPLDAGNGYLRAGVFLNRLSGKSLRWHAGVDLLAVSPRYRNVYIQQFYAGIKYKCLDLTIGSMENYMSLWDRELSSGDLVLSANARPIPEINIAIPQFTSVPLTRGILQIKGNFAVGRSFDTDYIEHVKNDNQYFTKNTLWHHKSFYYKLIDPQGLFPLTFTSGMRHHAQWGGTSSDPDIGRQPHSFKDFLRIIAGKSGSDGAYHADQGNALGNHYGSYDFKIGYLHPAFDLHLYYQHYFDDISGMQFFNLPDGLYGIQADFLNGTFLRKALFEFVHTRYQSGPIHNIMYDHDEYPGRGGGSDDYYNNDGYRSGISYFNRSLGSPLLTSPEYNANGVLGFRNNRVRAFHVGLQGYFSRQVAYRILATASENWGTMSRPFLKKENSFSYAAKISWCHPRLEGWLFSGEIGGDFGNLYGDNAGISISISKSGILKQF